MSVTWAWRERNSRRRPTRRPWPPPRFPTTRGQTWNRSPRRSPVTTTVAGRPVQLNANDIEFGTWDAANAHVYALGLGQQRREGHRADRREQRRRHPLFFARIFGRHRRIKAPSAIATVNPRDIAFVVDLSGSMNDDTDPSYTSSTPDAAPKGLRRFRLRHVSGQFAIRRAAAGISNNSSWVNTLTKKRRFAVEQLRFPVAVSHHEQ